MLVLKNDMTRQKDEQKSNTEWKDVKNKTEQTNKKEIMTRVLVYLLKAYGNDPVLMCTMWGQNNWSYSELLLSVIFDVFNIILNIYTVFNSIHLN